MFKKLLCLVLLFFAINVKAIGEEKCEKTELNRLKEIASHLSFSYEFVEATSDDGHIAGSFNIIVDNITSEIKPLIIHSWELLEFDEFVPNSNGTGVIKGFESGRTIKITVKAYVNNKCNAETVMIKTIKLPYINKFYSSKECKESPDFKFCKDKLTNINISETTFNSEYKKYLKEQELGNPEYVTNNTKIYIVLALMILIPLGLFIKNAVTNIIEKRKDEI